MARTLLCASAALAAMLAVTPAAAQTGAAQPETLQSPAAQTDTAAPAVAMPFGAVDPVQAEQLGAIVGQADLQQTVSSQNRAEVSRNSVSGNSVTGTIDLGSAFQDMNGLSVVSANTGNNVAINASMNVNIAIHQ